MRTLSGIFSPLLGSILRKFFRKMGDPIALAKPGKLSIFPTYKWPAIWKLPIMLFGR